MAEDYKNLTDAELAAAFAAVQKKERGAATPEAQSFLNALTSVPDRHAQAIPTLNPVPVRPSSFGSFFNALFDPATLLSARGLVSQGAFAAVLLVTGMVAGLEAAEDPQVFDDFDVSAGLFGSEDDNYALDG